MGLGDIVHITCFLQCKWCGELIGRTGAHVIAVRLAPRKVVERAIRVAKLLSFGGGYLPENREMWTPKHGRFPVTMEGCPLAWSVYFHILSSVHKACEGLYSCRKCVVKGKVEEYKGPFTRRVGRDESLKVAFVREMTRAAFAAAGESCLVTLMYEPPRQPLAIRVGPRRWQTRWETMTPPTRRYVND